MITSNNNKLWYFRLENEHLNNAGKFRAVKTVPLPFHEVDQDWSAGDQQASDITRQMNGGKGLEVSSSCNWQFLASEKHNVIPLMSESTHTCIWWFILDATNERSIIYPCSMFSSQHRNDNDDVSEFYNKIGAKTIVIDQSNAWFQNRHHQQMGLWADDPSSFWFESFQFHEIDQDVSKPWSWIWNCRNDQLPRKIHKCHEQRKSWINLFAFLAVKIQDYKVFLLLMGSRAFVLVVIRCLS